MREPAPGARAPRSGTSGSRRTKASDARVTSLEPRIVRLPVLVASREGYRNLCRLVTRMKLAAPKAKAR